MKKKILVLFFCSHVSLCMPSYGLAVCQNCAPPKSLHLDLQKEAFKMLEEDTEYDTNYYDQKADTKQNEILKKGFSLEENKTKKQRIKFRLMENLEL